MNASHATRTPCVLWPRPRWIAVVAALGLAILGFTEAPFFVMYVAMASLGFALYGEIRGLGVTARPVSFCLPGYRESLRRRHFVEGGLHGLAFALAFLAGAWFQWRMFRMPDGMSIPGFGFEWLRPLPIALVMLGVFFAGMTVHTAASAVSYSESWWVRAIAIEDGVVWVLLLQNSLVAPLYSPLIWFWLTPLWLALGVFSWIRLGDREYVLRGHGRLILRQAQWRVRSRRTRGVRRNLEGLFLGLMSRCNRSSRGEYCWGGLYESLAAIRSPGMLLMFSGGYVLVLNVVGRGLGGLGLALLGALAFGVRLPLAPGKTLLTPAGRSERALATVAAAVGASIALTLLGIAVVVASWAFTPLVHATLLSPFGLGGRGGIHPGWFYWPCLLASWVIAGRLSRGWVSRVGLAAVALVAVLSWTGAHLWGTVSSWKLHAGYVGVLICGWLFFLTVARARRRAGDLV